MDDLSDIPSTNPVTTRQTMPSMRIKELPNSILQINILRLDCNFYVTDNRQACSIKLAHLLHKMFTHKRIKRLE